MIINRNRILSQRFAPALLVVTLLASLITLSACEGDFRQAATGQEGVITVVVDSTLRQGVVGDALRGEIARDVLTYPVPEPAFGVEFYDLTTRDLMERVIKRRKNVVFVGHIDGQDNVSRFIASRLDSSAAQAVREGRRAVIQRPNLWYRDQMVVYVAASDPQELAETIRDSGDDLRFLFNRVTRQRVTRDMFERGRQRNLEDTLLTNHDFAVNVQHDYIIVQDTTGFVRMRRVLPDTWRDFWVYYIDHANPALITPEWILDTRDRLTETYVRGTYEGSYVKIDRRRPLDSENINFLGRYAYETRGLWHMTNDAMGGSFLNYTFYDEEQQRIYMLDGMIFAPQYGKREFLRQIEVISHTFRTREEVEARDDAIASN